MKFSKNLLIILNALFALLTMLIGTLLVINKLILEGIAACVIGILLVIWFNIWRTHRTPPLIPISRSSKSKSPTSLSQADIIKEKTSKRERLNNLIKEMEIKISTAQAKGQYFSALPGFGESVADLLKKKEQYIKELEKLK